MLLRRALVCSFCHRSEHEVAKLVAGPRILMLGPRVYICDRCAATVVRIMGEPGNDVGPVEA